MRPILKGTTRDSSAIIFWPGASPPLYATFKSSLRAARHSVAWRLGKPYCGLKFI